MSLIHRVRWVRTLGRNVAKLNGGVGWVREDFKKNNSKMSDIVTKGR